MKHRISSAAATFTMLILGGEGVEEEGSRVTSGNWKEDMECRDWRVTDVNEREDMGSDRKWKRNVEF